VPSGGPLNTVYTLSATQSFDPDNNVPLIFRWQIGDAATFSTTTSTITRTFSSPGVRVVSLVVVDSGTPPQASTPVTASIFVGNLPPTATIVLTNVVVPTRTRYHAGDTWQFGVANAGDDEDLPANAFNWNIAFHHREHFHPFLPNVSGEGGQFEIPPIGEPDPVVWYRVTLRVTDNAGQVSTIVQDLLPVTTTLTIKTMPPGGSVEIDGASFTSDYTITRVVGIQSALSVPLTRTMCATSYQFVSWSQGGNRTQVITVPLASQAYTATFAKVPPNSGDTCKRTFVPVVKR
jgi:hypothetical protein